MAARITKAESFPLFFTFPKKITSLPGGTPYSDCKPGHIGENKQSFELNF